MQKLDDGRGHVQPQFTDLRTCHQQKRKGKRPCKKQLRVLGVETKTRRHAARGLKDEVADKQRPTDAQHDLTDGIYDGNVLPQIRKIQTHEVKQHGRKILPAFQNQTVEPFHKSLKEKFQQVLSPPFSYDV